MCSRINVSIKKHNAYVIKPYRYKASSGLTVLHEKSKVKRNAIHHAHRYPLCRFIT